MILWQNLPVITIKTVKKRKCYNTQANPGYSAR